MFREYDLNLFYEDLGYNEYTDKNEWADVLTIQPSIYVVEDGASQRYYLEAFKLTLGETRAIAPDFPENEYGDDFFITLNFFWDTAKEVPQRVKDILCQLPDIESAPLQRTEIQWLHTIKENN